MMSNTNVLLMVNIFVATYFSTYFVKGHEQANMLNMID